MAQKVAAVTGSNKGLGFFVVKSLCQRFDGIVYLLARDENKGLEAVEKLKAIGLNPQFHLLDISDKESIKNFADFIKNKHGGLDVLVNNAAIMDYDQIYPTYEGAKHNIDVNYRSLLDIEEYVYPLLRDGARVVNVSSKCGHLSNLRNKKWLDLLTKEDLETEDINKFVDEYLDQVKNGTFRKEDFADDGKHAEHRVSKIAMTALTVVQQRKYKNISINAVYPGYMKTDMAPNGVKDPQESADIVMYLILEASPNLKGIFMWDNKKLVDWYDVEGDFYYKHEDMKIIISKYKSNNLLAKKTSTF